MANRTAGVFPDMRWFGDFSVGQTFVFGPWVLTRESMLEFARVYDPEPFHLDEDAARRLGWDGLIASGLQVASIWRRLSKDAFPNAETVISPGWEDIRWLKPAYAGDALTSHSEIREARLLASRPAEGMVKMRSTLVRQDDTPIARLTCTWFLRRSPESGRADSC